MIKILFIYSNLLYQFNNLGFVFYNYVIIRDIAISHGKLNSMGVGHVHMASHMPCTTPYGSHQPPPTCPCYSFTCPALHPHISAVHSWSTLFNTNGSSCPSLVPSPRDTCPTSVSPLTNTLTCACPSQSTPYPTRFPHTWCTPFTHPPFSLV